MKLTTSRSAESTNARSLPTWQMPSSARCHRSWPSDSAIETLNLERTRSLIARSTWRLPLSEWFSGKKSVSCKTPTTIDQPSAPPARAPARALRSRGLLEPAARRYAAAPRARQRRGRDRAQSRLSLGMLLGRGVPAHRVRSRRFELARDRFHFERLDHVVGLDVVVVIQPDTAFVARADLARVVLEAAQRADLAFPYDAAVANQTRASVARDLAVDHHRARDRSARHVEGLAHLGAPQRLFAVGRREQTFHRLAHLVERVA